MYEGEGAVGGGLTFGVIRVGVCGSGWLSWDYIIGTWVWSSNGAVAWTCLSGTLKHTLPKLPL